MRQYVWRLYWYPTTDAIVYVHMTDFGMARLYERWGWVEFV